MADIVLSAPVRNNLLALQNTAKLLGKTQERLATGLKVNSALDDPTAFFTSAALDARAGDLNRLLDTVDLAVQTIKAADQGITAITKLVESAQALARQALLIPTGSTTTAATVTGTGAAVAADAPATTTGTGAALSADAPGVALGSTTGLAGAGLLNGAPPGLANGDSLSITIAGQTTTINFTNAGGSTTGTTLDVTAASVNDLIASINTDLNTQLGTVGVAYASLGGVGGDQLQIAGQNADQSVAIAGTNAPAAFGLAATNAATNLLSQGITAGQTLTIGIGANANTITFGNGAGQVSTLAELNAALGGITGGTASVDANGNLTVTATSAADTVTLGGTATLTTFGTNLTTTPISATNATLGGITAGQTLTIGIGINSNTITFGSGAGQVDTLAELTTALGAITGGTAAVDANGNLTVTATNPNDSITLGGTAPLTTFGTNLTTTPTAPTATPPVTPNSQRANLATQYAAVLDQITQLARDASFNGTNLINSDNLIVIFNESNTSQISITGVDFTATGLGLAPAAGTFQTNLEINSTLGTLDNALRTLRAQAGTFGSSLSIVEVRKDFTKNLINTLETGSANLKLADSNEEGANLLALQTRQQLSSTALSLASQADQNVLRLFQ